MAHNIERNFTEHNKTILNKLTTATTNSDNYKSYSGIKRNSFYIIFLGIMFC